MPEEQAYQHALDFIYSFVDYSLTRNLRFTEDKFNLGRMFELMDRLGNPQRAYPVIHVAGTKGKGSTAAMIASALQAAGLRTGFYTSPHLQDYAERMQVNCENIPHADFTALVEQIGPLTQEIKELTTFELTTAMAYLHFAQQKCDVVVAEVGLGGRLDATNVVDPLVSVITSLSMDHTSVLGDTLTKIAWEKAGIVKPGRPVVLAPQQDEARHVVERVAAERGSPLTQVGKDVFFAPWTHDLDGQIMLVWHAEEQSRVDEFIESGGQTAWEPLRLRIPLLGNHQVQNAATAYTALKAAQEQGLPVTDEAIREGFASVVWPGRFEVLHRHPILVIDSAHNRDSALKLRMTIDDYLPGKQIILLFGASEDKDVAGMFQELHSKVRRVIATQSVHPRAMEARQIVATAHQVGLSAQAIELVEDALKAALTQAEHEKAVVVVAGSLFVAAAARAVWQEKLQPTAAD